MRIATCLLSLIPAALLAGCGVNDLTCANVPAPLWGYQEGGADPGPSTWNKVSAACGGMRQSPIDIPPVERLALNLLKQPTFNLANAPIESFENTSNTLQINFGPGRSVTAGTETYQLQELHFRAPAEHTVNGKRYAMEMQVVTVDNRAAPKTFVVFSTFFDLGAASPLLATVLYTFPTAVKNITCKRKAFVNERRYLDFFTTSLASFDGGLIGYDGSLTTPPCTEAASYVIGNRILTVSPEQVAEYKRIVGQENTARPVRPLNGRTVFGLVRP